VSDICNYNTEHVERLATLEANTVHQERDIQEMRSLIHEVRDEVLKNREVMNNGLSRRIAEEIEVVSVKERDANRARQEARAKRTNITIGVMALVLVGCEILLSVILH